MPPPHATSRAPETVGGKTGGDVRHRAGGHVTAPPWRAQQLPGNVRLGPRGGEQLGVAPQVIERVSPNRITRSPSCHTKSVMSGTIIALRADLASFCAMGFVKRIEIRWRDLDGFAHVNNSVYFTYGEEVRDEFFTGLLGHDVVNFMVVRNCQVDYRSGLTQADDYADVHVEITAVGRSSVTTAERIVSVADGRVAAESTTVTVHTNADDRAAAEPWDDASRATLEGRRSLVERGGQPAADTRAPADDPGRAR